MFIKHLGGVGLGALPAVCLALMGCTGAIEASDGRDPATPGAREPGGAAGAAPANASSPGQPVDSPTQVDPLPAGSPCNAPGITVGARLMRNLNRREYENTVRDLLGVTMEVTKDFPSDDVETGFDTNAEALVASSALVESHAAAADKLAAAVNPETLLACSVASTGASACAARFATAFGKRAYRRPLDPDEVKVLTNVYDRATQAGRDHASALRLVLRAILQSPQFLYHAESSADIAGAGVRPVSGYELASRLSYFLWSSMPDAELTAAADAGRLGNADEFIRQAKRMLADGKARETIATFHEQWLKYQRSGFLQRDAKDFPKFASIRQFLGEETERFIDHLFSSPDGKLKDLFGAGYSFMNRPLAQFYGVTSGSTTNTDFPMTALPNGQRLGLLTHASLLATYSNPTRTSPTKRGQFVRTALLCLAPPPPPADVGTIPETTSTSLRERLAEHSRNPACGACHRLIDPIGLGLEGYDAIGTFRASEAGRAVNTSGDVLDAGDMNGPFSGGVELSKRLAGSQVAARCVSTQWFRFALGRGGDERDACSLRKVQDRFVSSGGTLRDLLLAITESPAFRNILVEKGVGP